MWRAANGLVSLNHLGRQLYLPLRSSVQTLLNLCQSGITAHLPPDNIELTRRTAPLGIGSVTLTRHSHHAATMVELRHTELSLNGVVVVTRS
jgi:hypothetical protein